MNFTYLDPVARPTAPQEPYRPRLDPAMRAPRIAMFPNLFADSKAFLGDLAEMLARHRPDARFPYFDKKYGRYMASPASDALRDEIVAASDAIVLAYGHCGSCTSGVVHDGVLLARRGRPVCVLVTARFREEALFLASALGLPELPFLFLPHPVAGESAAFHRALAEAIAPRVLTALHEGDSGDASSFVPGPAESAAAA